MTYGISDDLAARLAEYQDRLEQAERAGAASLAHVFDNSPAGIGVHEIDDDMRIERANDEDLRILGYVREEFVGRRVLDFIVMSETAKRAIGKKLTGDQELRPFVRTFRRKDGSAVALVLLDRYRKDPAGRVIGLRTVLARADSAGT
jgi:PAS domain S-box-containing protein